MAEALLRISFAGPHVSIQDGGRPGWARFGVPQSGAMDRLALRAANVALANPADAAAVEISRGGLRLDCLGGEVGFALAGGGFILEHGRRRAGSWSRGTLREGEQMIIRPGPWGSWSCLAFAGQVEAPDWLGSRATHGLSGLGGGGLMSGRVLRITDARPLGALPGQIPCPVFARPRGVLRVTAGPQERFFDAAALAALEHGRWITTSAADRMGTRLSGPAIAPRASLDMASEPLARGSIQVAGDGVATVLMADHQTTGGYPRLATVLECDLDGFSQMSPGQRLAFQPVTAAEAVALARQHIVAQDRYLCCLAESTARALRSASS